MSQVAHVLHEREKHKEAIRGRYASYYTTLIEQRDGFYADRTKVRHRRSGNAVLKRRGQSPARSRDATATSPSADPPT